MASKQVEYALGDRVTWRSQAGSYTKTKIGTIVDVFQAGRFPVTKAKNITRTTRKHESYVVSVEEKLQRGGFRTTMYWPLVANLTRVRKAKPSASPHAAVEDEKLKPAWNGMCPAGKHGLDFEDQSCEACVDDAKIENLTRDADEIPPSEHVAGTLSDDDDEGASDAGSIHPSVIDGGSSDRAVDMKRAN